MWVLDDVVREEHGRPERHDGGIEPGTGRVAERPDPDVPRLDPTNQRAAELPRDDAAQRDGAQGVAPPPTLAMEPPRRAIRALAIEREAREGGDDGFG